LKSSKCGQVGWLLSIHDKVAKVFSCFGGSSTFLDEHQKVSIALLNLASVTLAGGSPRTLAQACCHFSCPAPEARMFVFVNLAAASKPFNSIRS
jgi:hypothetical protein